MRLADNVPDLLLAHVVCGDAERGELFQAHSVLAIDMEQFRRHGGEAKALLYDRRCDEEAGGNVLFAQSFLAEFLKSAELVEGMQRFAAHIFSERTFFRQAIGLDNARHGLALRHPLLLHQHLQRAITAPAGWYLEYAGLGAVGIEHRPHVDAL